MAVLAMKMAFPFTLPGEGPGCGDGIAKTRKSLNTERREEENKYGRGRGGWIYPWKLKMLLASSVGDLNNVRCGEPRL